MGGVKGRRLINRYRGSTGRNRGSAERSDRFETEAGEHLHHRHATDSGPACSFSEISTALLQQRFRVLALEGEHPTPPVNPWAGRAETVRRRFGGLVSRFGVSQLTSLEKAAVAQALDDYRLDRQSDLAESLASAEAALDAADRRLSR